MTTFSSGLSATIRSYLTLKRALGRQYAAEEWVLAHLDRFLAARRVDLNAETFTAWCLALEHLASGTRRGLWIHTISGHPARIPVFRGAVRIPVFSSPSSWECWNLERPLAGVLPGGRGVRGRRDCACHPVFRPALVPLGRCVAPSRDACIRARMAAAATPASRMVPRRVGVAVVVAPAAAVPDYRLALAVPPVGVLAGAAAPARVLRPRQIHAGSGPF